MEAMRQSWTDDRLDDLSHRMDKRFDQVEGEMKAGFERVDGEIKTLGKELRGEIAGSESRLHARLDRDYIRIREEIAKVHNDTHQMNAEMHAFQRTILQVGGGMIATLVVTLAGLLVTSI
jgi:hypothetical protein